MSIADISAEEIAAKIEETDFAGAVSLSSLGNGLHWIWRLAAKAA